ncbi:MAG: ATP-binding protein [Verrucomicrobia bacterium]|nr:ATP-binding protein [Verrucomicrobiota bacterium]
MNTRSLRFQLVAWYAGLLTGCFLLIGVATYLVLQGSLIGALKENQLRRARQIGQLLLEELSHKGEAGLGDQIETRYAPRLNDRFVRVTGGDGGVLYRSDPPGDRNFDPAELPSPDWPAQPETSRQVALGAGREMLLAGVVVKTPVGVRYLIEAGAPMDEVQAHLRQWLTLLLVGLPVVALVAIGGGSFLVKRALSPVDRIAVSAERISSQNLSERLPVARTGDELERLSIALNHMVDRLDQAFQYSRQFMADASHELRTPLTVLRGELEGFLQEPSLGSEWRERLASALEEVERLASIVEGLFAISRLDAGEAAAEWVKLDLARLTAATADQMSLLAEDKNIQVTCAAIEPVWVEGDQSRLKQVVVNLLDNAIKYTLQGGTVALSVSSIERKAVLEVTDNGIGIPADALPRVFDRFFRVDKARSRERGGAGLGLSIVKSICTAHHGHVEARSHAGHGSVFRVELPLAASPENNQTKHNHEH